MPISFVSAGTFNGVPGATLQNPTSLQFGPDGRLYVSEQNGSINAYSVSIQNGVYTATAGEELTLPGGAGIVKSIQNHNDDGSENGNGNRQVTGIVVTGTAAQPVLYISSSDPRIASNGEVNLDTNSGVVSRASWDSVADEWVVVDLVRGLPRSEENHAVNGMLLSEDGTKLLLQVGGFTNNGAPSSFFSYTAEYALSGAILELDLTALDALQDQIDPVGGQGGTPRTYKYDLPTLDDPNIANAPAGLLDADALAQGFRENAGGMDIDGPWGGNDGLNMSILPADAPLRLYADGTRNAYDLTRTENGNIYTVDNGSNGGLGGNPNTESGDDDGDGVPGEAINTPNNGGAGDPEPLLRVDEGAYFGHPNPVRANQNMEWTVYNDNGTPDTTLAVNTVGNISALVPAELLASGQMQTGYLIDPTKFAVGPDQTLADLEPAEQVARLLESGIRLAHSGNDSPKIVSVGSSTNGIVAYDSNGQAFDGVLDGKLFVTQFNDNVTLLNINDEGTALLPVFAEGPDGIYGTADDVLQDVDGILFVANNSLGVPLGNPLDVTVGPNGTLWVAEIGSNEITVLAPNGLILPGDNDSDDDGILNVDDPFLRDAANGTGVIVAGGTQTVWEFSQGADDTTPGPDGFGGGLTGHMINGTTDFEEFLQSESDRPGQNIQLDNVKFVTAAAGGTTTIEEVSNGDPNLGNNNGEFLFHTGFKLADNVDTFTVKWVVANPGAIAGGSDVTDSFQQIGGYIGDGTQSNYLKIVAIVTNNSGTNANIQIALENDDGIVQTINLTANSIFDDPNLVQDSTIEFELLIDPTAATATPKATYFTTSGPVEITGTQSINLTGSAVLETILGENSVQGQPTGIAAGLFSSNFDSAGDTFQAVFDSITVTATEAQVAPDAVDDSATTGVDAVLTIPVAQLLANDSDANPGDTLTVTAVSNPQNGEVSLNADVVTFTPDPGFEGEASFDYTISDGTGTPDDTAKVTITVADTVVLYRVNAGDAKIVVGLDDATNPSDPDLDWAANEGTGAQGGTGFGGLGFSVNTGNISTHNFSDVATTGAFAVPGDVPTGVFAKERWDPDPGPEMQWTFDAPVAGDYTVRLFMGNGFAGTSAVGQRVFDINIEGGPLEYDDVDLVSLLGGTTIGGMFESTVAVTDGELNIDFQRVVENPLINGIEILGPVPTIVPPAPTIDIVNGDQTVNEDDGQLFVSILTSETVPSGPGLSFTYVIAGATATPLDDYAPGSSLIGSGTATFTGTGTIAGGSSDFQIPIDILQDTEIEPNETFTVTITGVGPGYEIGNGTATVTIVDDDTVTNPGDVLYRINSGGPKVVVGEDDATNPSDTERDWDADQNPNPTPFLASGGPNTFASNVNAILYDATSVNGAPQAIFANERWDPPSGEEMSYEFSVETGFYTVNLYMAEGSQAESNPGARIFDVAVEDDVPAVFDNIEPFLLGGSGNGFTGASAQNGAFVLSHTQEVTDGTLNLDFLRTTANNPAIRGIEIIAADDVVPTTSVVSITSPSQASVVEGGDAGVTTLLFPVTFDTTPTEEVTVAYEVDINGTVTAGSLILGTADGQIQVDVPNDNAFNGTESVTVSLTGISAGAPAAEIGTESSASATVSEDDGGDVVIAINAGGPALMQDGIDFVADQSFDNGTAFADGNNGNGEQPVFDGTVYETERFGGASSGTMSYSIPVPVGDYTVELYFAEIFQPNGAGDGIGARVFDVTVEGQLVLDDFDILAQTSGDFNQPIIFTVPGTVSPDGGGDDSTTIDINFSASADNAKISAIVIRDAKGDVYTRPNDDLFGTAIEIGDTGDAPSGPVVLAGGDNIMSATQEGEGGTNGVRDRDYFTVTIPDGKILTGIFLDQYDISNQASPDGFFAFQEGSVVTTDPLTGANVDDLTGAIIYGSGDLATNLLEKMRGGFNDPASGNSLPAFDQKLTGNLTFWLNQGAGPNTPTLRFVVADDPDAGVPGAYLPNANGHFVFEAEDGYNGEGQWALKATNDLPSGHEAPSGGEYLEAIANDFGTPNGSDVLTYKFAPEEDGFIRINLITSRNPAAPATEHNDSWVGIQLDGATIPAIPQQGASLQPLGNLGLYKAYSSGGNGDTFDNIANKNVDNVGKAIVVPVNGGEVYDFLLANRSSGHEVDKVVLEFSPTAQTSPNNSATFHGGQPLSEQVPLIPVGEAVLTVNNNSNNIQVSNFANNSFSITNTGTKGITAIEIDVTDALFPDAVFDPLGLAGDTTAKILTLNNGTDGGTGLVVPAGGFGAGAVDITYIGTGGTAGFEKIRLEFTDFDPGETIQFGVDMDPNSVAGATKGTLDLGAPLTGTGATGNWDIGGISGAELAGSLFGVTYADGTASMGQLHGQGTGQQSGATALSSQDSPGLSVELTVNGLTPGAEGSYEDGGPQILIEGPAGEVARVLVAKGFIVPFFNNFPDTNPYKAQLDAQLQALEASGFPANNAVELLYVDVPLDGTVQDISGLFDFTQVAAFDLSVPDQTNEFGELNEARLPLGIVASVVNPATDESKGPVTSPIHLTFSDDPEADLSLTKTASDLSPDFGDDITFTVSLTNDGPDAATGVVVEDLLSSGFAFVSAMPSIGMYDEDTGLWTIDSLASDATATLEIFATVQEGGTAGPDEVVYRVNPGGDSTFVVGAMDSVDSSEPDWVFDNPQLPQQNGSGATGTFAPGVQLTGGNEFGNENGSPVIDLSGLSGDTVAVAGLFETERFGSQEWDFTVENGDYTVNLYFAEVFVGVPGGNPDGGVGTRLFNVDVEGAPVLENFDIFAEVGASTAVLKSFDTTVMDENLDVNFTTVNDNAKISAIEIIKKGFAGGPLDYINSAEVVASDQEDPDSTPDNASGAEDDEASLTVAPVAGGINLVTIAAAVSAAAEPSTDGQLTVALEEVADTDTVVTYSVAGTATPGADYAALIGTVTVLAGETTATIDVGVLDDLELEGDETVEVKLTGAAGDANLQLGSETDATVTIADDELPPTSGSALVEITPDQGLGASTFGGTEAFQVVNTGQTGDANIVSISIDLSTGILPDMVFDPLGNGGDATAQAFNPDQGEAATVGLVPFDDNAFDPFSQARNGGFDVITVNFTDFNPGEIFSFSVDIDPNSIQGVAGAGNAGAVSGYELIGSTVTITFSDGSSEEVATSSLYDDGSLGGAQSLGQSALSTAAVFAPPTIELVGGGTDESTLTGDQQTVALGATTQTVRVTGETGANVSLLQMDARLYIASGDDPFDVAPDELPFYANEAMSGKALYTGIIGAGGFVDIPVTLLVTPGAPTGTPDGGLNHFVAVLSDGPYAPDQPVSQTSNTLIVRQSETAPNTPPEITSADSFDFVEGDTAPVFTAIATDADAGDVVTFSLAGSDADAFEIDGAGVVTFNTPPTFVEGGDNVFIFDLIADDGTATDIQSVTVALLKDSDGDLVPDIADNAIFAANADQRDSNGDGYGNIIDADLNGDRVVDVADLLVFRGAFGATGLVDETDPRADADFNGGGVVDVQDLLIFRGLFGQPLGASFVDDLIT